MNRAQKSVWFRQELLFDELPRRPPGRGVVIDWGRLPGVLTAVLPGLKLLADDVVVFAPGNAERTWVYGRGSDNRLAVKVNASISGQEHAKDLLITRGINTMRSDVPYQRGPAGLGHVAACNLAVGGRRVIFWVFENILAEVKDMGCDVDVEPVARRLQTFMELSVVSNLRSTLSGLRLLASSSRIEVGQAVDIRIELPGGLTRESFESTILAPDDGRLELVVSDNFEARLRAVGPGDTGVVAQLADRRTLVSPDDLRVKIEVVSSPPRLVPSGDGDGV